MRASPRTWLRLWVTMARRDDITELLVAAIMYSECRLLELIIRVVPSISLIITIFFGLAMELRLIWSMSRPPFQRQPLPWRTPLALAARPPPCPRHWPLAPFLMPPPPWMMPVNKDVRNSSLVSRHGLPSVSAWFIMSLLTPRLLVKPRGPWYRLSHPGILSEVRPMTAITVDADLRARLDGRHASISLASPSRPSATSASTQRVQPAATAPVLFAWAVLVRGVGAARIRENPVHRLQVLQSETERLAVTFCL